MNQKHTYQILLNSITRFVETNANPELGRFKQNILDWGSDFRDVGCNNLPASKFMELVQTTATVDTQSLVEKFIELRTQLLWEQSYTSNDTAVGNDMLNGYAFVEVIGKNGPFISTETRCGIGVWGPNINYPVHQHQAEEIYIVLAGSAMFKVGDSQPAIKRPGDAILVESMCKHGFNTDTESLIVFYAWQHGDLREKSSFS